DTYCNHWLSAEKDELFAAISEAWPQIAAEEDDLPFASFEEWAQNYKAAALPNAVPAAGSWTMNISEISKGAKHSGFFNADLDSDGTIRRSRLIVRTGQTYMPSMALKAYLVANNYNAEIRLGHDVKSRQKQVREFNITDNNTGEVVQSLPVDARG